MSFHKFVSTAVALIVLYFVPAGRADAAPSTRPSDAPASGKPLRVMILLDTGASEKGWNFVTHCLNLSHPEQYSIRNVTGEDIRGGVLNDADVAIFPGGSGSVQAKSLEEDGREKVRAFVKNGGGYLGICGGAYLATSDYPWSLNIVNAAVVDKKHWARGRATLQLDFTELGRSTLDVPSDSVQCLYHQGPLLTPDHKHDLPPYEPLATFATEVADNGAPKGVMVGTNAMVRAVCGKGRVILISPHPEQTDGLDYIIRSAVSWISHPEPTANPLTGDKTDAKATKLAAATPTTQASPPVK
jgi:putative intracellular protease/amidase